MNPLETNQNTTTQLCHKNNSELNSLDKSAILTVLTHLRDSFAFASLTQNISGFDHCNKEFHDLIYKMNYFINEIIKIIGSENVSQKLHKFYTVTLQDILNGIAKENGRNMINITEKTNSENLRKFETKIKLLNLQSTAKELEEIKISGDTLNHMVHSCYENVYVKNWCNAKVDEFEIFCNQSNEKLTNEKLYYKSLIEREHIFETLIQFVDNDILQLQNNIDELFAKQKTTTNNLELLHSSIQSSKDDIHKAYDSALQILEDNKQWVIDTRRTDAAIVLQRAWRQFNQESVKRKALKQAALVKKLKKREKATKSKKIRK